MLRFRRARPGPYDSANSLVPGTPPEKSVVADSGAGPSTSGGGATPATTTTATAAPSPSGRSPSASPTSPSTPRVEVIDYVRDATRRHGKRNRSIADAVALFHLSVFAYHCWVWAWHWTPAAAALPGARGFGRFFRYLTFYSYTAQTAQFGLAAAAGLAPSLTPRLSPRARAALTRAADDAACAIFGLANVVTVMYYSLEAATAAVVEGGPVQRPPWLGRAVHLANAGAAWADLLVSHPRSFSPRAATASLTLAGGYAAWLLVVRAASGSFPYPILNALPMPWGYVGMTATALALFAGLFALGRRLSTPLLRVKAKAGWPSAGVEW